MPQVSRGRGGWGITWQTRLAMTATRGCVAWDVVRVVVAGVSWKIHRAGIAASWVHGAALAAPGVHRAIVAGAAGGIVVTGVGADVGAIVVTGLSADVRVTGRGAGVGVTGLGTAGGVAPVRVCYGERKAVVIGGGTIVNVVFVGILCSVGGRGRSIDRECRVGRRGFGGRGGSGGGSVESKEVANRDGVGATATANDRRGLYPYHWLRS